MALDVGDARIGVAVSDAGATLATPLEIIERTDGDPVGKVIFLAQVQGAKCIVVGLPKNMDGSVGPQARKVQAFARKLQERDSACRISFWDERLSTIEARSMLSRSGAPKNKRAQHVDAMSAAIILQGYLDHLKIASAPTAKDDE